MGLHERQAPAGHWALGRSSPSVSQHRWHRLDKKKKKKKKDNLLHPMRTLYFEPGKILVNICGIQLPSTEPPSPLRAWRRLATLRLESLDLSC